MATQNTNGGRTSRMVGRRDRPYANGSYQNYRWDNAVRQLKKAGWARMFKLTAKTRLRLPRDCEYRNAEGTIYAKYYDDGYGNINRVLFLLNEDTMNRLPGNLGIDWMKRTDG